MARIVLVLGAFSQETDILARELHKKETTNLLTFEIINVGVGPVEVAIALQKRLLEKNNVSEIIFLGSAGVYEKDFLKKRKYTYTSSQNFYFRDLSIWERHKTNAIAKEINLQTIHVETKKGKLAQMCENTFLESQSIEELFFYHENIAVNTLHSITLRNVNIHSSHKNNFLILLENLEVFGLARVASLFHIPFTAFLALTNEVDSHSSISWKKNYRPMSIQMQKLIISSLHKNIINIK